jgi:hypothetical protein
MDVTAACCFRATKIPWLTAGLLMFFDFEFELFLVQFYSIFYGGHGFDYELTRRFCIHKGFQFTMSLIMIIFETGDLTVISLMYRDSMCTKLDLTL